MDPHSLMSDLIAASGAKEATVKVIACTCSPGERFCECERVRRSTIVMADDAQFMAAVEEHRIGRAGS